MIFLNVDHVRVIGSRLDEHRKAVLAGVFLNDALFYQVRHLGPRRSAQAPKLIFDR